MTTEEPEVDLVAEMMAEAMMDAALEGEKVEHESRGRKTVVAAPEPDPDADEIVDLGPYCVECRDDTTGQDGRVEASMPSASVEQGPDGEKIVKSVLLKGWRCENCQPFENALIEETFQALLERRYDAADVRAAIRTMGMEAIWERWFGPMLDEMETEFRLETR